MKDDAWSLRDDLDVEKKRETSTLTRTHSDSFLTNSSKIYS